MFIRLVSLREWELASTDRPGSQTPSGSNAATFLSEEGEDFLKIHMSTG